MGKVPRLNISVLELVCEALQVVRIKAYILEAGKVEKIAEWREAKNK